MMNHQVKVGQATVDVSDVEYLLATMPKNTPIEWSGGGTWHDEIPAGVGMFLFSSYYDGVNGHVDMNGRRIVLMPSCFPELRVAVLLDTKRLDGTGMHGDAI